MYKNNDITLAKTLNAQRGVASLLFILLIGVSLTAVTLGLVATLRGFQDSSITSHAQTQAELKAFIGAKSLSGFLYSKDPSLLSGIDHGNINDTATPANTIATYKKSASCPSSGVAANPNYCFDVTASSGGATAILRVIYQSVATVGSNTLTGSVFAGGLVVGGSAKFTGDTGTPVQIQVKGGVVTDTSGKNINSQLATAGISVGTYVPTTFVSADSLKNYANYIFQSSTGSAVCQYNNLYLNSVTITTPTTFTCSTYAGISYSNGVWTIDPSKALPVGVLWFDKDVQINLQSGSTLVNSIISTGSITANSPTGNNITVNSYAPNYFYNYVYNVSKSTSDLAKVCGSNTIGIPKQYCNSDATFNTNAIQNFPGNLSNILFLTNNVLSLDAANKVTLNYYGNVISSHGAGGTGYASGKFTGTGDLNIIGNLVISGDADATQMLGNITIDLSKSSASNSTYIPSYVYTNQMTFIRYM